MDTPTIILIVFIALLVIAYPILISSRNKKENAKLQEQTNSLKRGDKVLTTSGVYGTIVDLQLDNDKKIVTIETGTEKKRGYISVDAYAIYTVFREGEPEPQGKDAVKPATPEKTDSAKEPAKDAVKTDAKVEENSLSAQETAEPTQTNSQLEAQIHGKKAKKK